MTPGKKIAIDAVVFERASELANAYAAFPDVEAVALGGSHSTAFAEVSSDLDLYVYAHAPIPIIERHRIATMNATRAEVDNQFWEPGDEWIDRKLGVGIDVMFRDIIWIWEQLERVLKHCLASVGYSTALWHNVRSSIPVFDRTDWFRRLQEYAQQPYPEALQCAIIKKNYPILRSTISSYTHQIERALNRKDLVSMNHRTAALLASYFDILFAVNKMTNPGEKRLAHIARTQCAALPASFSSNIERVLYECGKATPQIMTAIHELLDALDALLKQEGWFSRCNLVPFN